MPHATAYFYRNNETIEFFVKFIYIYIEFPYGSIATFMMESNNTHLLIKIERIPPCRKLISY